MSFRITSGAVIINYENKILLKKDPKRGWELPGGMVENSESIMEAVIREVKEETGIDIEIKSFCGVTQEVSSNLCNMWWLGAPIGGEFELNTESLEIGYFNFEDCLTLIKNDQFIKELELCLNKENHPFFCVF